MARFHPQQERTTHEGGELLRAVDFVGSVARLEWALSNGLPSDDKWRRGLINLAARHGSLEVVQYMKGRGFPWGAELCEEAAKRGLHDFAVLKWLREEECPWDARTSNQLAYEGHFEMLRWPRAPEHGCIPVPWDEDTCVHACGYAMDEDGEEVREMRKRMMIWMRATGCPWNAALVNRLAEAGELELFQWALAEGSPTDEDTAMKAAESADERGGEVAIRMLQVLVDNGHELNELPPRAAAGGGHIDVLDFLWEHRCPFSFMAALEALDADDEGAALQWLQNNGVPMNNDDGANTIVVNNA
jgi:hypothetical protein